MGFILAHTGEGSENSFVKLNFWRKCSTQNQSSIIGIQRVELIPGFAKATIELITFTSNSMRPTPIVNTW